jgi:hypothetical protein
MEVGILVISIDDNFQALGDELKNNGYMVCRLSDNLPSDIIVYSGKATGLTSLSVTTFNDSDKGVFLINGDNKGVMEIINMINNKTYSSIF